MVITISLEAARQYLSRGWWVVPIPRGLKGPVINGWQNLRLTEAELSKYFSNSEGVGLILGEPSGGLTDVDLDAPEARALAHLLPPTNMIHGRPGSPRSHYWYICNPPVRTIRFHDPTGAGVEDERSVILELRGTGGQTLVPPSLHPSGETYQWDRFGEPARIGADDLRWIAARIAAMALLARHWPKGSRQECALALTGALLRAGWPLEEVQVFVEGVAVAARDEELQKRVDAGEYTARRLVADAPATGWPRLAELIDLKVITKVREWLGIQREIRGGGRSEELLPPPKLAPEALQGLAGEIVRAIEPFTEADPVAILANLLATFGSLVGPGPHFRVEFTRHFLRLNIGLVGETSKGRKGQSWSALYHLSRRVDEAWAKDCVTSGLSSGEGLIYAVRDERRKWRPVTEGGRVIDYEEVIVDPGVADKRLLVVEEELAQALKVMSREGNILSVVIRQAWDTGDLHPLTKNNPIKATGAHISIIGHITKEELLRYLSETEQANGFANRFIWLLVRRSKIIPNPSGVPEGILNQLEAKLRDALDVARSVGEMNRDDKAEGVWAEVYPVLSEGKPGLLGAIIARAEAQVMRLACIYALMDRSPLIRPVHLQAALALWDYAEDSVRRIFGGRLGHAVADRILAALRESGELSETAIRDLFNRHRGAEIDQALDLLSRLGLAVPVILETGGRPKTVWRAATQAT